MNRRLKTIVNLVLLLIALGLGWWLYKIIEKPQKYEALKNKRYEKVIERLEQIRDAQKAYKKEFDEYAADMDDLIAYVDTGVVAIRERKDSSYMYFNEIYQKEMERDTTIVTILGYEPVKEMLFDDPGFDAEKLRYIPGTREEIEMGATVISRRDYESPVFEAKASNKKIFKDVWDEYEQFIDKEHSLRVGSLEEPTLSGNWK